ncbi:MAG: hypothetical protein CK521_04025 [Acidimicrobium sp.]|nr:MAG: hypothetical protein CK521_04025 [Acidimicrobium sp.]
MAIQLLPVPRQVRIFRIQNGCQRWLLPTWQWPLWRRCTRLCLRHCRLSACEPSPVRRITLKVLGLETAPCVVLEGALEQIVDNYIDNALTAAPDNSTITVEVQRVQRHIYVDVIDEGPGLSEEKRTLAFERFWRGATTENAPGTGLGLAIVRQLAVASGGVAELLPRVDGERGLVARISLLAR